MPTPQTKKYSSSTNLTASILLFATAMAAAVTANSPLAPLYQKWLSLPLTLQIGSFNLFSHGEHTLTVLEFINDGLMTIFFFSVGLEIKREQSTGELSTFRKAMLPFLAACGGMIAPVLVYTCICPPGSEGAGGNAIPMSTDIAFSLGVLSLLGSRVPPAMKIFLTTLAVADDMGGILVIALFYSSQIEIGYLVGAAFIFAFIYFTGKRGLTNKTFFWVGGIVVWYLFLQSGIHSTIAGVILAFTVPAHTHLMADKSPIQSMEDGLYNTVNYFILPLFAFANAGIMLGSGTDAGSAPGIFARVTLAVMLGLLIGKFIGIFTFTVAAVKLKISPLPTGMNIKNIAGVSLLGGIGFTVALFIAHLSFENSPNLLNQAKLGVIAGSVLSGTAGYAVLRFVLRKN